MSASNPGCQTQLLANVFILVGPGGVQSDLHIVDMECYNTFGNIWGLYLGRQAYLLLTDTEIIHKVFVEDNGKIFASAKTHRSKCPVSESFFQPDNDDWRRIHQILAPAFGPTQLRQKCGSYLQYLLDHEETKMEKGKKSLPTSATLTEDEVVAQAVGFLLRAYQMATHTLEFVAYLLARHPSVQHQLQQEVHTAIKQQGFTYENIAGMEYLDMVVMETLRLFPPVVWLQRTCQKLVEVCDLKISRGIQVTVPVWVMHHSREFWDHPCRFDPLRFTREERDLRDPVCYLPFGLGAFSCIGSEFSVMMVKVALASILTRYRFTWCSQTPMYLDIETLGVTRSKIPITLQIELL
ncbi:cytochrome P450 3A19-like [Chiloscyllium punctatum]|uniref:cytochrome P450 3A19-like n=1 Tax=Chiloscyllium punctatum TaxID=137246 RepID=UPI003B636545